MRSITAVVLLLLAASPATAQQVQGGQVAGTANGRAGELSSESDRVVVRVDARVQNRVQSRIRNRIDRSYSPQANAASPFATADDQLRAASEARR